MAESELIKNLLDSLKEQGCWGANAQSRGFRLMPVHHREESHIVHRPEEKTSSKP